MSRRGDAAREEDRIRDLLPFYAAATLPASERAEVERYLAECAACRRELELWRRIKAASAVETTALARQAEPRKSPWVDALRQRWALLFAQARLAGWLFWSVPVLLGGMGALLAVVLAGGRAGLEWLVWVAPLLPAAGIVTLERWEDGRLYELAETTATGSRREALARLLLVAVYDAALVSIVARGLPGAPPGLDFLASHVFGPMALLLGLSFLASAVTSPGNALAASVAGWLLVRAMAAVGEGPPGWVVGAWPTEEIRAVVTFLGSGWIWAASASLLAAGLWLTGSPRRLGAGRQV